MKEYSLSHWGASRINDEGNSLGPSYDSSSSITDPIPHHHHHLFPDDIDSNDIGNEINEISDPRDVEELALRKAKKKRSRKIKGKVSLLSLFVYLLLVVKDVYVGHRYVKWLSLR